MRSSRELEAHRCSLGRADATSQVAGHEELAGEEGFSSFTLLIFAPRDRTPQPLIRPGYLDLQLKRGRDIKVPKGGFVPPPTNVLSRDIGDT